MSLLRVQPARPAAALVSALHLLRLLRGPHAGTLQDQEAFPVHRSQPRECVLRSVPGLYLRSGAG